VPEGKTHAKTQRREEKTYTLIRLCQAEEQNSELCYLWFLLFKFVLAIFCSFASLREVLTSLVAAWSLCLLLRSRSCQLKNRFIFIFGELLDGQTGIPEQLHVGQTGLSLDLLQFYRRCHRFYGC
jgi:hypothetical protein